MRIDEAIESLRRAGPLNIVWGAGCSHTDPDAVRTLVMSLRVNCRLEIAGPAGVHDALKRLDRQTRREKTSTWGINWAHICLAELLRTGRVARILTANFDQGIVKASSVVRMLPDLYERDLPELDGSVIPCIYSLGETEPAVAAGLIERGAQTGPWLVIGASGEHFGLGDALPRVSRFEHGLYWVGYFDQPPPPCLGADFFTPVRGAHFIAGFDSASFLAYLLRAIGEFPPAFVLEGYAASQVCNDSSGTQKSIDRLNRLSYRLSERVYQIRDSFPDTARECLNKAEGVHGEAYRALVHQALEEYERYFRWSPSNGYPACLSLGCLAAKRGPAEASRLWRKGLEWIERFPAGTGMEAMEARQIADACMHLAAFRTGPEADALFAKAEQVLATAPHDRLGAYLLDQLTELLCRWADQERNSESDARFQRAREKFAEAHRLDPKPARLFCFARALRKRAEVVSGAPALELLANARAASEEAFSGNPNDPAIWQFLGLVAVVEGQQRSGRHSDWKVEAGRCFREALNRKPVAAGDILQSWAATIGLFAMARSGDEALELYALADTKFRESAAIKPDSRALRKNWSSTLLREARERGGPAELWQRAREQAGLAEVIDLGSGAYNLACIAAELGDTEGVRKWLLHAAEYGHMMPLSHTLRDVNFQLLISEPWFKDLLNRIFDLNSTW